jgi:hypothetical protein
MHLCPPNFWQTCQKSYDREKTASSTNVAGKSGYLPAENWNTCYHKYFTKDLNIISPETLKLAQEKAEDEVEAIGIGKDFLTRTQISRQQRESIDTWDYMKLKNFCTTK